MEYAIGIVLALLVAGFARWSGFDRDRAFYPTVVVVIAAYYVLFAAMGASAQTLVVESIVMGLFMLVAVLGFRLSAWIIVAALAGHGVFDVFHGFVVANPGVPQWWPGFCLAFDVGAALILAFLVARGSSTARFSHSRT